MRYLINKYQSDAYSRNESIGIGSWSQIQGHNISIVTMKRLQYLSGFDIPKCASCISGTGQNLKKCKQTAEF